MAEDKVLLGQAAIKNGAIVESNSTMIDLAAFNMKVFVTAALQHVTNAKQALHMAETSTQGLARSFCKARHWH